MVHGRARLADECHALSDINTIPSEMMDNHSIPGTKFQIGITEPVKIGLDTRYLSGNKDSKA